MANAAEDRLVPGAYFRDLDGSIVHLLAVDRDLCSWVAVSDAERNWQVTHRDNFRRRFRSFEEEEFDTRAAA